MGKLHRVFCNSPPKNPNDGIDKDKSQYFFMTKLLHQIIRTNYSNKLLHRIIFFSGFHEFSA